MKLRFLPLYLVAESIVMSHAFAAQPARVASSGETSISGAMGKLAVQVKIKTHEIQIGTPSEGRPAVVESSCTYSRRPCSVFDRLGIVVNGSSLFVPRSAFCDLADLTTAEFTMMKGGGVLTLHGGDASESYIATIEFDASQVKRRTLWSGLAPKQLLQETTYHVQSVGD